MSCMESESRLAVMAINEHRFSAQTPTWTKPKRNMGNLACAIMTALALIISASL